MTLRMEPGQTYDSWNELKEALNAHCKENKVIFNVANAKTVGSANSAMKKGPYYDPRLKYAHCIFHCKHFGCYTSTSAGLRPKQRSYKINCQAFISVSACRKENYLIIRDSFHKHTHPCTEEIYNSYPEVRRMTRDERRMVGHLLDLGVPINQIKTAVGKNVTPKDLHNAKSHIKAVKLGLKDDEDDNEDSCTPRRRRSRKELEKVNRDERRVAGEVVTDSEEGEEEDTREAPLKTTKDNEDTPSQGISCTPPLLNESHDSALDEAKKDLMEKASHESRTYFNPENPSSVIVGAVNDEKDSESAESGEMKGLSGLLAAAGSVNALNSGAEEEGVTGPKTSYTVIVSSDGNMEMTQTSSNLQELLKKVEVERLKNKSVKITLEHKEESSNRVDYKNCEDCNKYMSPLDGHSLCISCLGPQHLHRPNCEHCAVMKPEQLNIRRRDFVRMRMKALREMNDSKRQGSSGTGTSSHALNTNARRSKRVRKPKDFGPEMAVQTLFGQRLDSVRLPGGSKAKVTKCVVSDGEKEYVVEIPKREPDYGEYSSSLGMSIDSHDSEMPSTSSAQNTPRFEHLLRQTSVLEDIGLIQSSDGNLSYMPEPEITNELAKIESQSNIPGIPQRVHGKYGLNDQFESIYCSIPVPLDSTEDATINSMGSGLHKLAQNAVVQTKLAIYDKLFTKLGIGMADEALSILTQLCHKVISVTEISQEDLTNDLQTAQDTIHALRDVLEELGVMSKDSLSTAAHQRNISVTSLKKAKSSIRRSLTTVEDHSPTKRRKFQPFSRSKAVTLEPTLMSTGRSDPADIVKVEDLASHATSTVVMDVSSLSTALSTQGMASVLTVEGPNSEVPATFIDVGNKQYPLGPTMSLSGELLETLQNQKDGIIELHVVKDAQELVTSQGASVVHGVIQSSPIEVGATETSNAECE